MRVNPEEEGFDFLYTLITEYAAYKNAELHHDLRGMPEAELKEETEAIYKLIQEILEVGEL